MMKLKLTVLTQGDPVCVYSAQLHLQLLLTSRKSAMLRNFANAERFSFLPSSTFITSLPKCSLDSEKDAAYMQSYQTNTIMYIIINFQSLNHTLQSAYIIIVISMIIT